MSQRRIPPLPAIRVYVEGGVVQGAETLEGASVAVEVIDHDIVGADPAELSADPNREPCWRFLV